MREYLDSITGNEELPPAHSGVIPGATRIVEALLCNNEGDGKSNRRRIQTGNIVILHNTYFSND